MGKPQERQDLAENMIQHGLMKRGIEAASRPVPVEPHDRCAQAFEAGKHDPDDHARFQRHEAVDAETALGEIGDRA